MRRKDSHEDADQSSSDLVDRVACQFEEDWRVGDRKNLEDYLTGVSNPARAPLLRELLTVEVLLRKENGENPGLEDYDRRFSDEPSLRKVLERFFEDAIEANIDSVEVGSTVDWSKATMREEECEQPERIARYQIESMLGEGGFGRVYLAYDEELDRNVVVKVPKSTHDFGPEEAASYRKEAQIVAKLDHPHVVPVYDSGSTEDFPFYIVSKYIAGSDLATRASVVF